MAKTGNDGSLGTAEGALLGRASHVLHAESPILNDRWAILLLGPESQALARDPGYAAGAIEREGFDPGPIFALNIGRRVACRRSKPRFRDNVNPK